MPVLNSDMEIWIDELGMIGSALAYKLPDMLFAERIQTITQQMRQFTKKDQITQTPLGHGMEMAPEPEQLHKGDELPRSPHITPSEYFSLMDAERLKRKQDSVKPVSPGDIIRELNLTKDQLDALEQLQDMEVIKRAQEDIARIAKKWGLG